MNGFNKGMALHANHLEHAIKWKHESIGYRDESNLFIEILPTDK